MTSEINEARRYAARALMSERGLNDHHTDSYNIFVQEWVKDIVLKYGSIETVFNDILVLYTMHNYRFVRGETNPGDAHAYDISYVGQVYVDVRERIYCKDETPDRSGHSDFPFVQLDTTHKEVLICELPLMMHSSACYLSRQDDDSVSKNVEYAGCFIVKGKRRYIPMLRSLVTNQPLRFRSTTKGLDTVQIRSEHPQKMHRSTSTLEISMDRCKTRRSGIFYNASVHIPFLTHALPMTVLALALGVTVDEFVGYVVHACGDLYDEALFRDYLLTLRNDHRGFTSTDEALKYVSRKYGRGSDALVAKNILQNEVLPHLVDRASKPYYLAYLYGMLVLFREGRLPQTDRDDRANVRIVHAGKSLAILFRSLFTSFVKQGLKIMRRGLKQKKKVSVEKVYNSHRLTRKIVSAVATGTWSRKRKGVSHPMTTTNDQAIISQLRRISSSNMNKSGKQITPRMLHSTTYGYECAAETPEGEACGLVQGLALLTRVTTGSDEESLLDYLLALCRDAVVPFVDGVVPRDLPAGSYRVFSSFGALVGWCPDVSKLNRIFLHARRTLSIDMYATCSQDDTLREWRFHCDAGRLVRPLFVLENIHKVPDILRRRAPGASCLSLMFAEGCLEYVSPCEESSRFVAATPRDVKGTCTHLEVSDVSFVGVTAALAPLFRHNQGPRLVYWVNMCKQTIGAAPSQDRGSATTHNLWYGQRPIVTTQVAGDLGIDNRPDCVNVSIIFFPHSCNQEDAIVLNRASVDRGMFVSSSVRTYTCEKQGRAGSFAETFERPTRGTTLCLKDGDYSKLGATGIPERGARVRSGDVVIGKTVPVKKISEAADAHRVKKYQSSEYQKKRRDMSVQVRKDEGGTVASSFLGTRPNGTGVAKVRVRTTRVPEVGDKFSSRHAQKGIIGSIVAPEDLPFSLRDGSVPDLVMSPLGITSRMTMGKVLEILIGKAAAVSGDLLHGLDDQDFHTPLDERLALVRSVLAKAGFSSSGKERYVDGTTGEMIQIPVMSGLVSYMKLQHMVSCKAHARSTGPVHMLTRQPTEGRRLGGGLRFGPMEAECVIAHSASEILRERTLTAVDPFMAYVCAECGHMVDGNANVGHYFCRVCRTGKMVRQVEMGYSTKLMAQELNATGIRVKLGIEDIV